MTNHNSAEQGFNRIIELRLPRRLGYEKAAMDTISSFAQRIGFGGDIEAFRIAVSEAVGNAIKHRNTQSGRLEVLIKLTDRESYQVLAPPQPSDIDDPWLEVKQLQPQQDSDIILVIVATW